MASFGTRTAPEQKKRAAVISSVSLLHLGEEETPNVARELLPPEPACPAAALKSKVGTTLNSQFIP